MTSLIQSTINAYESTFLSLSFRPENAFQDDDTLFHSESHATDQWWQVSFSEIVAINSYALRSSSYTNNLSNWIINASIDNKTWKTVDSREEETTRGNKNPCILRKIVE